MMEETNNVGQTAKEKALKIKCWIAMIRPPPLLTTNLLQSFSPGRKDFTTTGKHLQWCFFRLPHYVSQSLKYFAVKATTISISTAAEISWYVSRNTGTAYEDLNYYKIKQHPWSSSRWSFTPTPQIFLILTLLPTLEFTYISETWKWQLVYVGENQLYFGCFHGKTELNILCLDPTAKSKWTENSQLFLSGAKCAICSHKVHLLVATVLQHYHKVPCDQGLVHKSRKTLWVTESPKQ